MSLTEAIFQTHEVTYTPEQVEIELQRYSCSIDKSMKEATRFDVCSRFSAESAQTMVVQARHEFKRLESLRKQIVDPYRRKVNQINDGFKCLTERLESVEELLVEKIDDWKEKSRKQEEEAEQDAIELAREMGSEVMPQFTESHEKIRSKGASSYEVEEWKFSLENLEEVPREFLKIEEEKVKTMIKCGVRQISGIKIYSEKKTVIRSR